jgi:transposase
MNYEAVIAEKDLIIRAYEEKVTQMQKQIVDLSFQLTKLQRIMFGSKSERFVPAPIAVPNLFSGLDQDPTIGQAVEQIQQTVQVPTHERKKSNQAGRTIFKNLPENIEVVVQKLVPENMPDGTVYLSTEIHRKLAYVPGKFFVKQLEREKYVDKQTGTIYIEPRPAEAIDKCEADTTLLAHVAVSKFVDHTPEYRQQQIFKRTGVIIPQSSMNDWTHRTAEFIAPISESVKRQILDSQYIQIDESTIRVMQKNKTKIGYMWVITSPKLGMSNFDFYPSRSTKVPKLMLDNYTGSLQSDGYTVYEVLEKANDQISYYNCWSHARRKFEESKSYNEQLSTAVLAMIQQLYEVEQKCRDEGYNNDQRKEIRQKQSKPVLEILKEFLEAEQLRQIAGTPAYKAIGYTLTRWSKLKAYIEDGAIEIDNNLVENAIRPLALGRKNYLFAGSDNAAKNIAVYYTIFSSCKSLGVDPYTYLVWVLNELPKHTIKDVDNFTPAAYANLNHGK